MAEAALRIAVVQFDSVVGDVEGNCARLTSLALEASRSGASLCVTPELSMIGYPPRDLLLREGLADACMKAAQRLARDLATSGGGAMATLVGLPITTARKCCGTPAQWRGRVRAWQAVAPHLRRIR